MAETSFTLTCLERWRGAWLARGYRIVDGVPVLASLEAGQWPWVRDRVAAPVYIEIDIDDDDGSGVQP